MAKKKRQQMTIQDATMIYRNFAGKPTKYNAQGGRRTFCVLLDEGTGNTLSKEGWNIKWLKPREGEEDEPRKAFMEVIVNYQGRRGPQIHIFTEGEKAPPTIVTEATVGVLDYADVASCDMILNPFPWTIKGESGIKPYLAKLYVTIRQDELDRKYSNRFDEEESPDEDA